MAEPLTSEELAEIKAALAPHPEEWPNTTLRLVATVEALTADRDERTPTVADTTQAWDDHVLHLEEQIDTLRAEVRALTARLGEISRAVDEYEAQIGRYAYECLRTLLDVPAATADPTP